MLKVLLLVVSNYLLEVIQSVHVTQPYISWHLGKTKSYPEMAPMEKLAWVTHGGCHSTWQIL